MKKLICLTLIIASATCARAQSMSMDDAIKFAQDSAITAHISRESLMKAQWEYEEFKATLRPQLTLELNPGYQKFTNEPALHYYKLRNYNMLNTYGGLQFEQAAPGIGGSFYANSSALWTEYFGADAAQRVFSTSPLGVGYYNELLGYNPFKWDKKIRSFHMESEEKAYAYELENIASEAERYFIDCLVANSAYEIASKNCEVTGKALEIGKEKFAIASITKNELFALELQKLNAENKAFDTKNALTTAREKLFSFLRIEDSGQNLLIPDMPEYRMIRLEDAISSAQENNPTFRDVREDVIKAEQNVEKARIQGSFLQTAIDLNVGLQSNSGYLSKMYSNQSAFVVGGVTLRIPILDGGRAKSRSKVAEYNLSKAQAIVDEKSRSLEIEIKGLLNEFNTQQDLLVRTVQALGLADESFEMAQELYGNGEIDINTFILALQRKDDSYQNYLKSLKAYWDSWYALKKVCMFPTEFS